MQAATLGHLQMVRALLEAGADVLVAMPSGDAVDAAEHVGHAAVAKLLRKHVALKGLRMLSGSYACKSASSRPLPISAHRSSPLTAPRPARRTRRCRETTRRAKQARGSSELCELRVLSRPRTARARVPPQPKSKENWEKGSDQERMIPQYIA